MDEVYKNKEVIKKEVAGYRIIADLLSIFVNSFNNKLVFSFLPE
ncbi:hypothetical protein [Polaribacter sp. SA4-10]|nr:hypothetical protein [Polaribacter sp. SA4-10]